MKTLLLSTALAGALALPTFAQNAASPFQAEAAGPSVAASDVIGARVYVSEAALDADAYDGVQEGWNDIGEVNEIILGRDGTVDAVLVDIGGFLGVGERQVAVDMSALRIVQDDATDADDWFLVLQADRATLDAAPEWVLPGADMQTDATAQTDSTADSTNDGTETMSAEGTAEGTDATTAEVANDATGGMAMPEGYTAVGPEALTSELLTGANVHSSDDMSIAEVSDLVLTEDGQVTDVVLDVGGFLGIGARSVAIPMDRLIVGQAEGGAVRLWVNMTREELETLPEFTR